MEYMGGGSIQHLIDAKYQAGEKEVAIVAYSVLKALEELHSRNIIHRDIKVRCLRQVVKLQLYYSLCDQNGSVIRLVICNQSLPMEPLYLSHSPSPSLTRSLRTSCAARRAR